MEPPALRRGRSVKAQRRMSVCVAVLVGKALVKAAAKAEAKVEAKVADAAVGKLARAMARPARAISPMALAMKAACSRA